MALENKRGFGFSSQPKSTTTIDALLEDEWSSNSMKLICLIADALHKSGKIAEAIRPIADVKKNKDNKEFTVYRLSSKDAQAIWEAL
jgi:hypothetical protein